MAQRPQQHKREGQRPRPMLGTPPHLLSLLWPLTPLRWMATVWGMLRGEAQTPMTCVIIEESHKRGPRASAGPPPTPSQHPLGLQELCGGLSRLFWKCF